MTRAELEALQVSRLKATLARAYTGNPFYTRAFDNAGVRPDDLVSLADLARFPFTVKSDLRDAYPFGFFAAPMDQIARIHASSGTTGKPTVVGYTRADLQTWAELVARCLSHAGVRPGMRVHVAYGYGLFTGGLGAHYGAEALGCTVIPMSGGQTERQVQLIRDFKPEVIMVTPSYLLAILDEFRRQGLDPRASSLRIAVLGAEPWSEGMRQEIEVSLGLDAVDIYGLSEVMGPGVAMENVAHKGTPTIWEDHFLPEIVDPATGLPVADGEDGELVFTSLTKEAMPVVRYRTRDLTRLLPGVDSPMRRMSRIFARCDDMLIIRGVNVFPSQIEEQLLKCPELAPHFLIEVTRPGRMDEVTVHIEPRAGVGAEAAGLRAQTLRNLVKEHVGITIRTELCPHGGVARSGGKAVRVRDLRTLDTAAPARTSV